MSDDDDLFADSGDDTDDLIAASKKDEKPVAKPKKRLQKKGAAKKRKREAIPGTPRQTKPKRQFLFLVFFCCGFSHNCRNLGTPFSRHKPCVVGTIRAASIGVFRMQLSLLVTTRHAFLLFLLY